MHYQIMTRDGLFNNKKCIEYKIHKNVKKVKKIVYGKFAITQKRRTKHLKYYVRKYDYYHNTYWKRSNVCIEHICLLKKWYNNKIESKFNQNTLMERYKLRIPNKININYFYMYFDKNNNIINLDIHNYVYKYLNMPIVLLNIIIYYIFDY
jgi:hypothetical protein